MITLGIHDGHTATACLMRDGKVAACISEERLNRVKEWGGFPERAITKCLEIADVEAAEVDGIGIVGLAPPTDRAYFEKPHWFKRLCGVGTHVFPNALLRSNVWVGPTMMVARRFRGRGNIRHRLARMGFRTSPVFYDHHSLHALSAYYASPFQQDGEPVLVLTCDGSGDLVSGSVNVGSHDGLRVIERVNNYNSLGEIYTRITQYLGMTPMSHEFKVMGLAPYAKREYAEKTYRLIQDFIRVDHRRPLRYENRSGAWKWRYLKKFDRLFDGHRFDNIARAAQMLVEEVLGQWVRNAVRETGIRRIAASGGVFMNVKANQVILDLPEIDALYVMPSGGDDSLPIGAAMSRSIELGHADIEPLRDLYFGTSYTPKEVESALEPYRDRYQIQQIEDIDTFVGHELSQGKVIARFAGRMEWGARALGNRSILADARNPDVIMKINEAIKNRDFWMPFAPSILTERANDYIINPKGCEAPYMIMAFPTTERAKTDLRAALHPYDFTGRPQMVEKSWNIGYHKVLKAFEAETGVGGILNTSFNLHGDPIVCSPADALLTFERSALDGLAIENSYVSCSPD